LPRDDALAPIDRRLRDTLNHRDEMEASQGGRCSLELPLADLCASERLGLAAPITWGRRGPAPEPQDTSHDRANGSMKEFRPGRPSAARVDTGLLSGNLESQSLHQSNGGGRLRDVVQWQCIGPAEPGGELTVTGRVAFRGRRGTRPGCVDQIVSRYPRGSGRALEEVTIITPLIITLGDKRVPTERLNQIVSSYPRGSVWARNGGRRDKSIITPVVIIRWG
jgi:hypothetical protein